LEPVLPRKGPLIVGIGASAGGVEALQALFTAMPPRLGMAFVVSSTRCCAPASRANGA
jgi:chemotaxis response regulator CheB